MKKFLYVPEFRVKESVQYDVLDFQFWSSSERKRSNFQGFTSTLREVKVWLTLKILSHFYVRRCSRNMMLCQLRSSYVFIDSATFE